MPVRRSSSNGGSLKFSRKPGFAVGSSKGSGDGARTPRFKGSDVGIGQRKARVGGVGTGEARKDWSKKVQSRGDFDDAVPFHNVNGKLSDMRNRVKRDWKSKSGSEGHEAVIYGKFGRNRNRGSADPGIVERGILNGNDKKSRSQSNRNKLVTESGRFRARESLDKKARNSKIGDADKPKHVRENGLGTEKSNIYDKRRAPLATQRELTQTKNTVGSVEKPLYKKDRRTKTLLADSTFTERPKKKKRGIRLDPYDTSNKRLDDSISDKGDNQVKIDKTESSGVEMSKNAQFRAICPSSSILSFVDDNFLGRRREIEFRRAGYNIELPAPLDNIPFSTTPERERIEVPVFRNKLEFTAAAKISSSFPPPELPEIAFAGRSNVGKSSLLNALTRQWGVVRTSDKPGLTQSINFFKLGPKLCMVDLPGYGFAYAKEEVKEAWEELVKEYVMTRVGLKRVCLLIDTKWGMKPRDLELIDLMERYETKYQIVLTKTDLVFPIDVARRAMQIEENLKAKKSAVQPLMMISSKTGAGIRSLRTVLANVARFVR